MKRKMQLNICFKSIDLLYRLLILVGLGIFGIVGILIYFKIENDIQIIRSILATGFGIIVIIVMLILSKFTTIKKLRKKI
jgi:uncharacterized membrane protein YraQ (UPF0718 family)